MRALTHKWYKELLIRQVLHVGCQPSRTFRHAVISERQGIKKYGVLMSSDGIIFLRRFMKSDQLVLNLKRTRTYKHTHTHTHRS